MPHLVVDVLLLALVVLLAGGVLAWRRRPDPIAACDALPTHVAQIIKTIDARADALAGQLLELASPPVEIEIPDNIAPIVPAPAPPPVVVATPAPEPPAVIAAPSRSEAKTTIRLLSAKGRLLGTLTIPAKSRRPQFRHRCKDGLISVFTASGRAADGVWEYRRVAVERCD